MKNKKIILGSTFGVIVIALFVIVGLFLVDKTKDRPQEVSSDDPTDIVLDFYQEWLEAAQSTSTTPYQLGLTTSPILSKTLSDRLVTTGKDQEIDPVLCQKILPTKVSSRTIIAATGTTQILVLSKEPKQTGQAVYVVSRLNDGWYIDDILCSQGESEISGEFSFDHVGGLYKNDQLQAEEKYWSLLYLQNDQVYTARLFFTPESICTDPGLNESVCNQDQFTEMKVVVQGDMSETGVAVKKLKFIY